MELAVLIFCVAVEAFIVLDCYRRVGFVLMPIGIILYMIGSQIVLYLSMVGNISYVMLDLFSVGITEREFVGTAFLYLLVIAVYYLATLGVKRPNGSIHSALTAGGPSRVVFFVPIGILYLVAIIHIYSLDSSILYSNGTYLLMGSPEAVDKANFVSLVVQQAHVFIGLISWSLLAVCLFDTRLKSLALVAAPPALWFFVFALAGHSRAAAIFTLVFAAIGFVLGGPRARAVPIAATALTVLTLISVLNGRNLGFHGLSSLGQYFSNLNVGTGSEIFFYVINVFEGVFTTSQTFSLRILYAEDFKLLSFSPLPSAIDGFSDVRLANEFRLHEYVPASAMFEAIQFGPVYLFGLLLIQFLAVRQNLNLLARTSGKLPHLLSAILFLCFYLQFTYPIRNVFRAILFVMIFSLVFTVIKRMSGKKRGPSGRKPPGVYLNRSAP